ncbi:predicted protein [Naegleria gruberi]|uniref:Predicted protein n=1 Tax=Naegleria gruberi TaxID=5762 RepID=D2VGA4_NAEGR|nr:uncharacterized protein NAEGRDRAFT_67909 [Naegleria gruberi]EFC44236.1 predicted protein [Naegleria gruberi]|eukprot:XP_002676980.1 predicted protein [Naegleria gruberi strain NEG-M]
MMNNMMLRFGKKLTSTHSNQFIFGSGLILNQRNVKTDINKISRGDIIKDGPNKYLQIERYVFSKRGRCNAIVTVETVDMLYGKKISKKYRGGESVDLCEYTTKDVVYSSENNKGFVFEDMKDGTEYVASKTLLTPEMTQIMQGGFLKKMVIGIDEETNLAVKVMFPTALVSTVEETEDPISGVPNDRHSPVTKNALLDNGISIKVPGFIANGDRVKFSTRDWSYVARATEEDEDDIEFEDESSKYEDNESVEEIEEDENAEDEEDNKRR